MKKIKVAYMKELLTQVDKGDISFSRMCELIDEHYQWRVDNEEIRKGFCLWYYAQSQPLDANKVFKWFLSYLSKDDLEITDAGYFSDN